MTRTRLRVLALEDRANPVQVAYQGFDSVSAPALPDGWTGTTVLGSADSWQTSDLFNSTYERIPSSPNYATTTATGASEKRLDSPILQIPNDPSVQIRFSHGYGFIVRPRFGTPTPQVNGGVLEVSINGGAFQDILAAGGSFVSGGYDGTVLPTAGNPLAGRPAWADTTYVRFNAVYTYRDTVVNLPATALGQSVQFRWRMATDELGTWLVDSIRVGSPPSSVQIASGDGQSAHVRTTFARPIEVRVVDQDGVPLEGVKVNFAETPPQPGSIYKLILLDDPNGNATQVNQTTDVNGLARVRVYASGNLAGTPRVVASIDGGLSATFHLTTTGVDFGRYLTSAFGAGPGGGPQVRAFNDDGVEAYNFFAYDPAFRGGVVVSVGDVTGDQYPDIVTGTQSGGAPHVKVFDGGTGVEVRSFFAFDPAFTGGLSLATTDLNADGFADIVVGAGPGGGPHVRAYSGKDGSLLRNFFAFDPGFRGGVSVAAGNGQIVVGAGAGGGPHVKVYDTTLGGIPTSIVRFQGNLDRNMAIGSEVYTGIQVFDSQSGPRNLTTIFTKTAVNRFSLSASIPGATVTAPATPITFDTSGRLASPAAIDITVSGIPGAIPQTITLNLGVPGQTSGLQQFGGASSVAAVSQNGIGPQVSVYESASAPIRSFFAFPATFSGGVNVAIGDFDNDGVTDYVAGQKSGGSAVSTFSGRTQTLSTISPFGAFAGGVSVAGRDVNRDSIPDLSIGAGRGGGPRVQTQLSNNVFFPPSNFPADFFVFDTFFTGGVNVG